MKDTSTERVGRYQLLEPIGLGPCGTVSRAKVFGVAGFERQFAVKRFHPELTITAALAQALSAAARAYGSLEHPRIARMSEFGVAQGQTFTAVELVPGLDALRLIAEARLAGASLAAGGALALVSQAARAVGYAHGRGLVHLGLAPTNVIVTPDGDIKITDFALLAAGLPQRPVDVARLAQRIQYLAPEQLANEATSSATDVFALGVIAYELVTGQRTFRGDTPQQIAQSIMTGPPAEPPLPRPIVRVLQRCLARSPFERFPDARALADALDAALRVAPVPGTRKDVGAMVKQSMDRIAQLHEGEMSGFLALNVGTGPVRREEPVAEIATLGRDSQPNELERPDTPAPGAANTLPDMPRQITTMTGLPPPPIPVPPGVTPPSLPPRPGQPGGMSTLLGLPKASIGVPRIMPRPNDASAEVPQVPKLRPPTPMPPNDVISEVAPVPKLRPSPPAPRQPTPPPTPRIAAPSRLATDGPTAVDPPRTELSFATQARESVPELKPELEFESERHPSAQEADEPALQPVLLGERDVTSTEMSPVVEEQEHAPEPRDSAREDRSTNGTSGRPRVIDAHRHEAHDAPTLDEISESWPPTSRNPSRTSAPPPPSSAPGVNPSNRKTLGVLESSASGRNRSVLLAAGMIGAIVVGVGGWQIYKAVSKPASPAATSGSAAKVIPSSAADAGVIAKVPADAAAKPSATGSAKVPADAAQVAKAPADAAQIAKAPADAAAAKPVAEPAGTTDTLKITSKPPGAHVYLDGSESGVTPLKLPGTTDRHTIALLLAGHDLYIAEVDGHGVFSIPLTELTPTSGPAGIKVIKCKEKDRHYVFVDGKPTGQMCPTERIGTDVGPHTVEVYDAGNESRKKWDIVVKDTRLSYRVKVE